MSIQRGDQLVESLCAGTDESVADELLNEVFSGYPIERLGPLLHSKEPGAVKAGAWILSELGSRAAPMMDEIELLLQHSLRYARFFAIDVVLVCATEEDGHAIATVVERIADSDNAVRWKALRFLARASERQLLSSVPYLTNAQTRELTMWLASRDRGAVPDILARLEDAHRVTRRFAVAAAARLADDDPSALERAAASTDEEVGSFASDELESLAQRRARRVRRRSE